VDVIYTIDTGASCSIVSTKTFQQIAKKRRPILQETSIKISGAGGTSLKCRGCGTFNLQLGPLGIQTPMIVADITDEILLGADVLMGKTGEKADILLSQGIMTLRGKVIQLEQQSNSSNIRKVHLADSYVLPAMSEIIADVFVERTEDDINQQAWIIEPNTSLAEKYSVAMAASLVDIRGDVTAKVRMMNPFNTELVVTQDTVIGFASPVETIKIITECEDFEESHNHEAIRQLKFENNVGKAPTENSTCPAALVTEIAATIPEHLTKLFLETSANRSTEEVETIAELLRTYQNVFSKNDTDLGLTTLTEHVIDTGSSRPVKQRPRTVPLAYADEDKKTVQKLLEQGSIRPSTSPWASPMVFVRKKNGEVRPCIDYRKLNSLTRKDAFPLPRTRDCLDAVAGATLFTSLDITSAYNQIPVHQNDIAKTAFVTKYGLFEYTTMPFGLCNAPATFQRIMEVALSGLQWTTCLIYLDDVLIYGKDFMEQIQRIEAVLQRIELAGLKLKPSKCHLLKDKVVFLGHILTPEGIQPNHDNINKILSWEMPTTVKEVQSFLGMTNYYRRFIQNYSTLVRPMIDLTKKGHKFQWTSSCQTAFNELKQLLTDSPIMSHPQDEVEISFWIQMPAM